MYRVWKIAAFHLICILIFAMLYQFVAEYFDDQGQEDTFQYIDFLLLSTTIQAGVGIAGTSPTTAVGKAVMILQQALMLFGHAFTIYVFTTM